MSATEQRPARVGLAGLPWLRRLSREAIADRRVTRRELLVAALLLLLVALAVFGRHVLNGSLSADDWAVAENVRAPSAAGVFHDVWNATHYRPFYAVYYGSILAIIGVHPTVWLAFSLGVNFITALMFYLVLRELRVVPLHAGLLALLGSTFPLDDATTLWFSVTGPMLAAGFYFAGLLVVLTSILQ